MFMYLSTKVYTELGKEKADFYMNHLLPRLKTDIPVELINNNF